jgi:hypothetical protein
MRFGSGSTAKLPNGRITLRPSLLATNDLGVSRSGRRVATATTRKASARKGRKVLRTLSIPRLTLAKFPPGFRRPGITCTLANCFQRLAGLAFAATKCDSSTLPYALLQRLCPGRPNQQGQREQHHGLPHRTPPEHGVYEKPRPDRVFQQWNGVRRSRSSRISSSCTLSTRNCRFSPVQMIVPRIERKIGLAGVGFWPGEIRALDPKRPF